MSFYAEINEKGKCFHVTDNPLPEGEFIKKVDSNDVLGKIWNGEYFIDDPDITEPPIEPTQLDRIEEQQLILMEAQADQYEEHIENRINDMEVQATIYETLLEMQGGN